MRLAEAHRTRFSPSWKDDFRMDHLMFRIGYVSRGSNSKSKKKKSDRNLPVIVTLRNFGRGKWEVHN